MIWAAASIPAIKLADFRNRMISDMGKSPPALS